MTIPAITPMLLHIASIALGFAVFYIISDFAKAQKLKQAGEAFSQLINFVLFIWLSKILLNLALMFRDPLALLAYPSGSKAFYLAVLFSAAVLLYGTRKGRIDGWLFVRALWLILLPAAFFYEFARFTWFGDAYAFGNLILYAALLAVFLGISDKLPPHTATSVLITLWACGMLLGSVLQSYPSAFGYVMEPWFILLFFAASQALIFFSNRRRATHECY